MTELNLGRNLDLPRWRLWGRNVVLRGDELRTHHVVFGRTGSGKSRHLASAFLQLYHQREGVAIVDSMGTLSDLILGTLELEQPPMLPYRIGMIPRLLYFDWREDDSPDSLHVPFNTLKLGYGPHRTAASNLEVFKRAWKSTVGEGQAPMFELMFLATTKLLISNDLPLTYQFELLTQKTLPEHLLAKEEDETVRRALIDFYGRFPPHERIVQAASTIRRSFLTASNPAARNSLSQPDSAIDFKEIIDSGTAAIFNFHGVEDDARRLLTSFVTHGFEEAALTRHGTDRPKRDYWLLIDEAGDSVSRSAAGITRILAGTRQMGLYLTLATQFMAQYADEVRSALQNADVLMSFRTGREDAEVLSRAIGRVDPMSVKSDADNSVHPLFFTPTEQRERMVGEIQDLPRREALVSIGTRPPVRVQVPHVPDPQIDPARIERTKQQYRQAYYRAKPDFTTPAPPSKEQFSLIERVAVKR